MVLIRPRFAETIANTEAFWRIQAHWWFDQLWATKSERIAAYRWLAQEMGLTADECHMKQMSIEQCKRVIELVKHRIRKEVKPWAKK